MIKNFGINRKNVPAGINVNGEPVLFGELLIATLHALWAAQTMHAKAAYAINNNGSEEGFEERKLFALSIPGGFLLQLRTGQLSGDLKINFVDHPHDGEVIQLIVSKEPPSPIVGSNGQPIQ